MSPIEYFKILFSLWISTGNFLTSKHFTNFLFKLWRRKFSNTEEFLMFLFCSWKHYTIFTNIFFFKSLNTAIVQNNASFIKHFIVSEYKKKCLFFIIFFYVCNCIELRITELDVCSFYFLNSTKVLIQIKKINSDTLLQAKLWALLFTGRTKLISLKYP